MSEGQVILAVLLPHAPVLIPAVGGKYGDRARDSVNAMVRAAEHVVASRPDSIVLISPHTPRRRGAFALWKGDRLDGSLAAFGATGVAVDLPVDASLAGSVAAEAAERGVEIWPLRHAELDHGAVVPLWHLVAAGWHGPTVLLGLNYPGEPGLVELGQAIAAAANRTGRRVAVVASGDMSHRLQPGAPAGFHPRAREFDLAFIDRLRAGDFRGLQQLNPELQELAAEDAVDSTLVAAAAASWDATGHEVLNYEGPFGVGYGIAILYQRPVGPAAADRTSDVPATAETVGGRTLPQIARRSLEAAFRGEAGPPDVPAEGKLRGHHGVFVTIRDARRKLRGCVGTLSPKFANVAEETWHMARNAAFRDDRFKSVTPSELEHLRFEVSVILPPEDAASPADLDPCRYGVVVSTDDGRRGVLLPDIDGVETVAEQMAIARRKGGIGDHEPVRLQRFAVKKYREDD